MRDLNMHISPVTMAKPAREHEASSARRVTLPGGIWRDGTCYKHVYLRELTGADEEILCGHFASGAQQVTALLTRAIAQVEDYPASVDAQLIAQMLAGDRDYLLLRLRQIEVGDQVHEVMRCRNLACAQKVDVEFLISEIPLRCAESASDWFDTELSDAAGKTYRARLRLPNGADLAAIADLLSNSAAANTRLFAHVLHSLEGHAHASEDDVRALPLWLRAQLAAFIAHTAPGPDLRIDIACPHCGTDMSYSFDLNAFFLPSVP